MERKHACRESGYDPLLRPCAACISALSETPLLRALGFSCDERSGYIFMLVPARDL